MSSGLASLSIILTDNVDTAYDLFQQIPTTTFPRSGGLFSYFYPGMIGTTGVFKVTSDETNTGLMLIGPILRRTVREKGLEPIPRSHDIGFFLVGVLGAGSRASGFIMCLVVCSFAVTLTFVSPNAGSAIYRNAADYS